MPIPILLTWGPWLITLSLVMELLVATEDPLKASQQTPRTPKASSSASSIYIGPLEPAAIASWLRDDMGPTAYDVVARFTPFVQRVLNANSPPYSRELGPLRRSLRPTPTTHSQTSGTTSIGPLPTVLRPSSQASSQALRTVGRSPVEVVPEAGE